MNSGASVPGLLAELARLDGAHRPHSLSLPAMAPADAAWVVASWHGREALGPHGAGVACDASVTHGAALVTHEWWVDLLSADADLPLDALLGQPATLSTRTADGGHIARTGLVAHAAHLGRDQHLARYRLQLVPWTWLLGQGRHSRVFQGQTVLQIVQAVLADYAPHAVWQVADEVGPFLAAVPPRSYCVQYRESDADFLARILVEDGLGLRVETCADAPAGHRLVVFAQSAQSPQEASATMAGGIRFHRSDATEQMDAIQALGALQSVGSTSLTLLSHDYKTAAAISANVVLGRDADAAAPDGAATMQGADATQANDTTRERYDPVGAYAFADRDSAQRAAEVLAQAHESRRQLWLGRGTVRTFTAGHWFPLLGAPRDGQSPPDEVLLTAVWHAGVNQLPEGLGDAARLPAAMAGLPHATWAAVVERATAVGYANAFVAIPRALPWRPVLTGDALATDADPGVDPRLNPRPTAPGYQTAIVVGPSGQTRPHGARELHSDALGRIRVRFHWQGARDGADAGASGAPGTATDTCWLRVAQRYAGPGVGTQFLPRIGQEVLVAFLEGDIDRPVVVGSLYNGRGDPAPGGTGNLAGGHAPAWHGAHPGADTDRNAAALLGFKSKEFGGDGHNRLVLDDSDGQLRLQLATTHAASQLTLGYLIHQHDNHRGAHRGDGFELRSDQWGAVRAERGLWVSAYGASADAPVANTAKANGNACANAPAGEQVAAVALLKQAADLAVTMSGIAITHQTVRLAAHEGVQRAGQSALTDTLPPLKALHASARALVPGADWSEAAAAKSGSPSRGNGHDPSRSAVAPRASNVPHTEDALLGLAAPAGIGLVAGQSLHWSSGETLTLASGQASNLAVAGNLRLHAGQAIGWLANAVEGASDAAVVLSLVTAEGALEFEAQNNQLKLQSRDGLRVISANAEVELAAGKTVHLATSGGASITIEGGNISVACPGQITVHAGKKEFLGGAHLSREMNAWPDARFDQRYVVRDRIRGTPMANVWVEVTRQDGAILRLVTDQEGRLPIQKGRGPEQVSIRVLGKE